MLVPTQDLKRAPSRDTIKHQTAIDTQATTATVLPSMAHARARTSSLSGTCLPVIMNTRLCSEAGAAEARGRQALQDTAVALEKRVVEVETRVRGCEALAVRADNPRSVSTR